VIKTLIALVVVLILLGGAVALYARTRAVSALLQVAGAACLMVVVFAHVFETLNLFPSMGWGAKGSVGHYLDLASAVLGAALLAVGYLMYLVSKRKGHAA
jgi:hypothetical protein